MTSPIETNNVVERLRRYVEYVRNTGQRPLPCASFDEDWEPAGPMIRRQLVEANLIEEWGGALMLTDEGEAMLSSASLTQGGNTSG